LVLGHWSFAFPMLKALELFGFKSFADKTRFEFPAGITVIVGPNGSGKSNIVDCIKWVLGEQSAKSLRGKDMADVIFKGSGAGGRRAMNTAEATLVFDNADRKLPVDAPEVHITRRVYRSGEGEYLINRQPARLKDIRDLFRGTGVGVDAYSLIEQGKVDRMLQASAKDRRAIFEEAAGISRFKAKKVEAQRRLERVEQNLLRLSDIVEEVENRLKTVRAQAGKARRYREYSDRLQQLRTQVALVDWRRLTEQLTAVEGDLSDIAEQIQVARAEEERLEARQLELETVASAAGEELRNCENQLALARQQIAQHDSTMAHERSRSAELEEEAGLHQRNLLLMSDKAGDVLTRLKATQDEVAAAQEVQRAAADELTHCEAALAQVAQELEQARQASDTRRKEYFAQVQAASTLASQVDRGEAQLSTVQQTVAQLQQRMAEMAASEGELAEQLAAAREVEGKLAGEIALHQEQLEAANCELAENRNLHASRADDLAQLHGRRRGVSERAAVLEEFERTLEGIGAGVKEVLARAGAKGSGNAEFRMQNAEFPWSLVRGVVADVVHASVEHAAAIDVALGDAAQAIVIEGGAADVQALIAAAGELSGRVIVVASEGGIAQSASGDSGGQHSVLSTKYSVLSTKASHPAAIHRAALPHVPSSIELTADIVAGSHVIARADKLVECADEYRSLVTALLGRTFVVGTLDDAVRLHGKAPVGARFVTQAGELVDESGAIHFGPRQSATSLVSRRSQLRAARVELAVLDQQIADAQRETHYLKCEIERQDLVVRQLLETEKGLDRQAAAHRAGVQSLEERTAALLERQTAAESALAEAANGRQVLESSLERDRMELQQARGAVDAIQQEMAAEEQVLAALEHQRQRATELVTAAKVDVARSQQHLESLRLRLTQFEDDQRERERAMSQVRQQIRQARERQEASQLVLLAASAQIAILALRKEALGRQALDCIAHREAAQGDRAKVAEELTVLRRRALGLRDREHQLQLSAEQVRGERKTLADRLREDYGIELAEIAQEPSPEEASQRAAVEEEIASLRRKINQIGAVNLEALDELDDLEQRFANLSSQHKDLTAAKQSLERIIHRINADSRRLFLETLEAIRVNFQALYRKAFGGGKADIVLEEGVDVLDCGVEIIATPPGKPSFNNSLLSGGEKALTAVALLLAIFQFRPSPFCILDEVDAPFDEANIGRFIEVLNDFLSWTRFVIVTHSKKTMTAATTLYGVTMQESGISKRVSVRFEDVSDDGHIRREAVERAGDEEATEHAA
jgi:chromosome segregation protein